jgi:ADP-L-glycero-D-manno-heptose 6-epimerase
MIIVTGGAGFIGSALIWELNRSGRKDIIIVDDFSTSDKNPGKNEKFKNLTSLKFTDLMDRDDFGEMVHSGFLKQNEVETLYHLGACSATTELDYKYLLRNNYEYTKFLCGHSVENKIRFVYASSAATYGSVADGYSDDESRLETLRPLNMYGYSKHLFDLWAQVLDADAFEAFKEKGLFDKATADAFRTNILERGGTEDPMVLYKRFRGAEPDIVPLIKRRGLE